MKHTKKVKGIDLDNNNLALRVGDLYYDSLSEFLLSLSQKIRSDGGNDNARGRVKLAKCLYECADSLEAASKASQNAWDICEPYVREYEKSMAEKDNDHSWKKQKHANQ